MKGMYFVCLLLLLLSLCARTLAATPINPSTDLTYLGAFKLPTLPSGYVWNTFDKAGYNGGGMSFYPPNGSLLVMGGPGTSTATRRYVAEVGIPELKADTYPNLNAGILLHNLVNVLGVDTSDTYANLGDVHYFTKQGTQSTDKLYFSVYGSYPSSAVYDLFNGQFAWAETDLDNLNLKGWWRFGAAGCRYVGKYIFHITDTDWADQHVDGKYLLAGYYHGGGGTILGPSLYAFAPWESCSGDCDTNPPPDAEDGATPDSTYNDPVPPELKHTLPYHTLLQYSGDVGDQIIENGAPNDKYGAGAWVTVGNKSAVVFYGWRYSRAWVNYQYHYPSAPVFVPAPNEGYHDEPGYPALFFYDVDDLAAVADGTKPSHYPQPYAVVDLMPYFYYKDGLIFSSKGMAYDETNNVLYLRESTYSSYGNYQAVHAFNLSDVATSMDNTPPSTPAVGLDSVSHESISLSWDACTDDNGKTVVYEIFRNDDPIAFSTSSSFTDEHYEYYPPPVKYYVVAKDICGNKSTSNLIYVDDSNGGNAPINMFISTLGSAAEHETSTALRIKRNTDYTFTPTAIGGTPPYTWSATGLFAGLSINSVTGTISGNVGDLHTAPSYTPVITVIDSAGNICRRRTGFSVGSESSVDLDRDGYDSVADGGTDADDTTALVNPLNPTQPAPRSLKIAGTSSDSVTLTWAAAVQRQHYGWHKGQGTELNWRQFQGDITYQVYYGTSPGTYSNKVYIGRATSCSVTGGSGTYYFAITAHSYRGLESAKSNEIPVALRGGGAISVKPATASSGAINGQVYGAYFVEGADEQVSITETDDGGVVLASWSGSYAWSAPPADYNDELTKYRKRLMLVKVNSSGVEQWRRIIGPEGYNITAKQIGSASDKIWVGTGIIETGTGDLIVCGYKGAISDSTGIDVFLMKFDDEGTITWDRSYNSQSNNNDFGAAVVERAGGGFAISRYQNAYAGLTLTTSDGALDGMMHFYNEAGQGYVQIFNILKTSDNGFLLAGWTAPSSTSTAKDYYVVKTTSDGTLEWGKAYDISARTDRATSAQEDESGNFWIFGRSTLLGYENTEIWALKVDPDDGSLLNSYKVAGDENNDYAYIAKDSIKLASGNFVIAGYTNVSGGAGYDGYLSEINTSGVVQWTKTVGMDTGYNEDYLQSIVLSADGTHYLCAGTNNGTVSTAYDLWFLKLATSDRAVENFTANATKTTYYYDKDLDGSGNSNYWQPATGNICIEMPGYVMNADDPDDTDPLIYSSPDQIPEAPAAPTGLFIISP